MKRIHIPVLLFISLILGQTTLAEQVYKWTDDKGVTHFSDTPPPEKIDQPEILSLPDIKAPAPKPQYSDATVVAEAANASTPLSSASSSLTSENAVSTKKQDKQAEKITLNIINLEDDQTIRSSRGFVTVQVELSRKLGIGESLQLMMDMKPYGAPQTPLIWELENIDRGSHTISVNIVENGKVIASSNTITVHLHRTTVK